jgi:predicted ester cyclase
LEDNKAIVCAFVERVWNRRQLDRAGELVAPDFVDHAPMPGQAPGLEGVKRKWAMYLDAIPDFRVTIEELVAEGDPPPCTASLARGNKRIASHSGLSQASA